MKIINGKEYFGLKEAAARVGYSEQHLRRRCHEGKYPALRRGRAFLFTEEMIAAMSPKLEKGIEEGGE